MTGAAVREVTRRNRRNARLACWALILIFGGLLWRLGGHQLAPRAGTITSDRERLDRARILAERCQRGTITDCWGEPLAVSWFEQVLVVDPHGLAATRDVGFSEDLREIIAECGASLLPRCRDTHALARAMFDSTPLAPGAGPVRYRVLTRPFTPEVGRLLAARLAGSSMRSISLEPRPRRTYPAGPSAAQVVGLTGATVKDGTIRGRLGVELALDRQLSGRDGDLSLRRDGTGDELTLGEPFEVRPCQGCDVRLTLDSEIQRFCCEVLALQGAQHDALATSAVVLDVATGEILAAASHPSFDPSRLAGVPESRFALPAFQHRYSPGSTVKPMFLAWALHTGAISETETFDCGGASGRRRFGRREVEEFGVNPEPLDVTGILMRSSNVGAVRIGVERLGLGGMWDALEAFGVASPPRIAYPAVPGWYYTKRGKSVAGYTEVAFPQGYEMAVSPLGLASMYLTLARDGEARELSLVRSIRHSGGELRPEIRSGHVVDADAVRVVLHGMQRAVEDPRGTAHRARSERWTIAAKTGTGEVENAARKTRYNAWFCGITPASDPRIVVVVHTQVRRHQGRPYTGGRISGPAARSIIERTLEYLQVTPDRDSPEEGR